MGKSNVSVTVSYLRYIFQMSILPYLSDTGAMYLEYLTEDTFKSIFPNPDCNVYVEEGRKEGRKKRGRRCLRATGPKISFFCSRRTRGERHHDDHECIARVHTHFLSRCM